MQTGPLALASRTFTREKAEGVHYTPGVLARYVAEEALQVLPQVDGSVIQVLDPACGDGELLLAVGRQLSLRGLGARLVGFDADASAAVVAKRRLAQEFGDDHQLEVLDRDFLEAIISDKEAQSSLWPDGPQATPILGAFDLVIANPPYVRTQVLGASRAQELGAAFQLDGRVDLYQAFVLAIRDAVREGGGVALILSNRFLTVKAGATLRRVLARDFHLQHIVDLGDSKLFQAAVLPALVFGNKSRGGSSEIRLTSAYEERTPVPVEWEEPDILAAIAGGRDGIVRVAEKLFRIRTGVVVPAEAPAAPWVAVGKNDDWLTAIDRATHMRLADLGKVRVGIKTTADTVFIRESWEELGAARPERALLKPLITHHSARRWHADKPSRSVLYPYDMTRVRRTPLDLSAWPLAAAYLQENRPRLEGREYVTKSGRAWWEIWVPQRPAEWAMPKIVFPDISERPTFFIDDTSAIVNGDCYWLCFREENRDLAVLAMAVANSHLAERYYDARCGNKLYAGRRRFITQYVEAFPIPDPHTPVAQRIVALASLLQAGCDAGKAIELENEIEDLVWAAFGIKEIRR